MTGHPAGFHGAWPDGSMPHKCQVRSHDWGDLVYSCECAHCDIWWGFFRSWSEAMNFAVRHYKEQRRGQRN